MTNNKNHSEDIIRKVVQRTELESPSNGFTDNVMKKIQIKGQIDEVKLENSISVWQWILIGFTGVLFISGILYYFKEYFAGLLNFDYLTQSLIPYISELFQKTSELFSKQEFSPILIIVIVSVSALMLIDRFFYMGKRMKSYLFTV